MPPCVPWVYNGVYSLPGCITGCIAFLGAYGGYIASLVHMVGKLASLVYNGVYSLPGV